MQDKNLTILLVAYKPRVDLLKTLILQFNSSYPIIIANNSQKKLDNFFYTLKNVSIIDVEKNMGNGAGINICLDECKTDLALYIDIDAKLDDENFSKLLDYSKKIEKFSVLVPNGQNLKMKNEITKKWDMEGTIMLINKKLLNNRVRFDESYFLYYEEMDFFFNCIKNNINVYFLSKVTHAHERASSIEIKSANESEQLYLLRQWHLMWSNYFFFKKNFNNFIAIKKNLPTLVKDIAKLIFYFIKFDLKSFNVRYSRISGLISAFLNLKSSKRLK